jgi:phosphohistidine phosphatase
MRRLILMRHAKSSWADPGQADHDRPLNGRGRRAAAEVGAWLAARGLVPGAALVSSAARTRETWARLGPAFAEVPVAPRPDLYHASPEAMLRALRGATEIETVAMVGHQPGIGVFAARLLAAPPADAAFAKYPTAATAVIEFDADGWAAVDWGAGRLAAFITPAALE